MEDFLEQLKDEHKEAEEVMDDLEKTLEPEEDSREREELFFALRRNLIPHLKGEEMVFYSRLLESESGEVRMDALEAFEEHRMAETLLRELDNIPKEDEVWAAKCKVLMDTVRRHIEFEEEQVFDDSEDELDEEDFDRLLDQYLAEKRDIQSHMAA
jgi:DNA-binding Lrp family transcriptional regulator